MVQNSEKYHTERPTGFSTKAIMHSTGIIKLAARRFWKYHTANSMGSKRMTKSWVRIFVPCNNALTMGMTITAANPDHNPKILAAMGAKLSNRVKLAPEPAK